jgi:hypothetical protein
MQYNCINQYIRGGNILPYAKEVTDYINETPEKYRIILTELRNLIHESISGTDEVMKDGIPVFTNGKDFSYIRFKKRHVRLGFYNFSKIKNHSEKLKGKDDITRHVKLKKVEDIDHDLFSKWLKKVAK